MYPTSGGAMATIVGHTMATEAVQNGGHCGIVTSQKSLLCVKNTICALQSVNMIYI